MGEREGRRERGTTNIFLVFISEYKGNATSTRHMFPFIREGRKGRNRRKDGRTDGRKEERKKARKEERKEERRVYEGRAYKRGRSGRN